MDASPIVSQEAVSKFTGTNSDRSKRGGTVVFSTSPWTQIVRGDPDSIIAAPSSQSAAEPVAVVGLSSTSSSSSSLMADEDNTENWGSVPSGSVRKKPAWNKPSNGSAPPDVVVMGAESWPALSESAKAPSKSNSDSLKSVSDSSLSTLCTQGAEFVSSNLETVKQITDTVGFNSTRNTIPSRQRSFKRNTSNAIPNGSTNQPYSLHVVGDANLNNASPRDQTQRFSQVRNTNDHQQQRNNYKTRAPGRGDTVQYNSYGIRRDSDRGNQEWNNQNFNNRDSNLQSQRGVPRFVRQPPPPPLPPIPTSTPFIVPAPVRPFGSPLSYPDYPMYYFTPPMDTFRGMPFFPAPMSPVYFPSVTDPLLQSKILHQIEYYFSNANLVKDTYLRQNMDEQGWVPISLIANFNKVLQLTDNIQLILDSVRASTVVEVQGDKVRRRNEWMKWILTPTYPNSSGVGNSTFDVNKSLQNLTITPNSGRKQVETSTETSVDQSQSTAVAEATPVSGGVDLNSG